MEGVQKLAAPLGSEDIAVSVQGQVVLRKCRMDTVLEGCAYLADGHAGARQIPFVSEATRCEPDSGKRTEAFEGGQAPGVKLVGLVDVAYHNLGFCGMSHLWNTT